MKWTKNKAVEEIRGLIDFIHKVAESGKASPDFTRWYLRSRTVLDEVFGPASRFSASFRALTFQASGSFVMFGWDINEQMEQNRHQAFVDSLNHAMGILQAALDELDRQPFEDLYESKNTPRESSQLIKIIALAERKLRKVIRSIPSKEREVQDAFENLLIGAEIAYTREGPHIEYSSKNYIPDFSFDHIDLALDMKLCARSGREKELIAEINDDVMAYKTRFGNLGFIIYDVGMIRDIEKFSDQFVSDDIFIAVIKH